MLSRDLLRNEPDRVRTALANRDIVPVLTCAATTNRGVNLLLDALIDIAPAPGGTTATTPDGDVRLAAGESRAITFWWSTDGLEPGQVRLRARAELQEGADPVPDDNEQERVVLLSL